MNRMIMTAKLKELGDLLHPPPPPKTHTTIGSHTGVEVTTVTVTTAEQALALMQANGGGESSGSSTSSGDGLGFGVVLMDNHFENVGGVLTGEEAMVQLRAQGHTLPIIMCTGNCSAQDTQRYTKSGASAVWPKPYPSSEEMAASLTRLLGWTNGGGGSSGGGGQTQELKLSPDHQQELQLFNYKEEDGGTDGHGHGHESMDKILYEV